LKRMRCEKCKYRQGWEEYPEPLAMVRLYVKHYGTWLRVGWVCPNCGKVVLDRDVIPFKSYETLIEESRQYTSWLPGSLGEG